MQLSDEVLFGILNGAGATPAGMPASCPVPWATGAERRRTHRVPTDAPVSATRYGGIATPLGGLRFRDVSGRGVGLVMADALLAPGEQFVVHAPGARRGGDRHRPRADRGAGVHILCTARNVRVRADGRIGVGAEFTAPCEPSAADHLISMRSTVGGSVRLGDGRPARADPSSPCGGAAAGRGELSGQPFARGAERVPLRAIGSMCVCSDGGGDGPVERVEVLNLSAGGVGIMRRVELPVGLQFVLRVPRVDEEPVTRLCVVTRVGDMGGLFMVGAKFIPFSRRRGRSLLARVLDWVV
jgi:hypothetical protein